MIQSLILGEEGPKGPIRTKYDTSKGKQLPKRYLTFVAVILSTAVLALEILLRNLQDDEVYHLLFFQ